MEDSDTIDNGDADGNDEIIMRMILKSKSTMMKMAWSKIPGFQTNYRYILLIIHIMVLLFTENVAFACTSVILAWKYPQYLQSTSLFFIASCSVHHESRICWGHLIGNDLHPDVDI